MTVVNFFEVYSVLFSSYIHTHCNVYIAINCNLTHWNYSYFR